jgi:hypothetical protein
VNDQPGPNNVYVVVPSSVGTSLIPLNSMFSTVQNVGVGPAGATGPQGIPGQGFNFRGEWNVGDTYVPYDVVTYQGACFVAISQVQPGNIPAFPTGPYWNCIAQAGAQGPAGADGTSVPLGTTIAMAIALG